jgi:hypothetical protein
MCNNNGWISAQTLEKNSLRIQPGLPDFSWYNIPEREKVFKMTTKCSKGHQDIPKCCIIFKWPKIIPTFSIPKLSKIYIGTQIGISGKNLVSPTYVLRQLKIQNSTKTN